jgi:prepilin-type N-terminal cleavage/methylation domain-containing protein
MNKKQHGVTLIELTVVLLILVALAGLVSPYVGGTGQKAMCEATDVSMQNIKKVIMENYYVDTLGRYPRKTQNPTTSTDYNLTCLFESCNVPNFDPVTNVGFRKGSYLQNGMQLSATDVGQLNNSFTNNTDGVFVNNYLTANDMVILDAWGRPIVLQVPSVADCQAVFGKDDCARLVSAGSGNGVGLNNGAIDTLIQDTVNTPPHLGRTGDDRILYLNIPTPSGEQNTPCDQY